MASITDVLSTIKDNPVLKAVSKYALPVSLALEVLDGFKKFVANRQDQSQGPSAPPPTPGV